MKKLTLLLIASALMCFSCQKDDVTVNVYTEHESSLAKFTKALYPNDYANILAAAPFASTGQINGIPQVSTIVDYINRECTALIYVHNWVDGNQDRRQFYEYYLNNNYYTVGSATTKYKVYQSIVEVTLESYTIFNVNSESK